LQNCELSKKPTLTGLHFEKVVITPRRLQLKLCYFCLHKFLKILFTVFILGITTSFQFEDLGDDSVVETEESCDFVFGLEKALQCAHVADEIMAYNEAWPESTNSTIFFERIVENKNLQSISFCYIQIDSLLPSIGKVSNLVSLEITKGLFTTIPKEVGKLKKLKSLSFGWHRDECKGAPIVSLPKEIGKCKSLEFLGLAYSALADLPLELSNCKSLGVIDLSYNTVITAQKIEELRLRFPGVEIIHKQ
jgi:hypothetical protein